MHELIEKAWEDRNLLRDAEVVNHIETVIEKLDRGELRVAEPVPSAPLGVTGSWIVNDWVKKAVIMYFPIRQMHTIEIGPLEFHDKMKLKHGYAKLFQRFHDTCSQ